MAANVDWKKRVPSELQQMQEEASSHSTDLLAMLRRTFQRRRVKTLAERFRVVSFLLVSCIFLAKLQAQKSAFKSPKQAFHLAVQVF